MDDHLEVEVLFADRIDVVLDVAQRACLSLRVVIIDVVNDLLFTVALCQSTAGLDGECQNKGRKKSKNSHLLPPFFREDSRDLLPA